MSYLTVVPPPEQSTLFPSDADQQRLRALKISLMSEPDLWRHHAYAYGFRRVVLGSFDKKYPRDELGEWFNGDMAARAERWYRLKLGVKEQRPAHQTASHQDAVRTDWKRIPATDLTDAERKIAAPEIARMSREAQFNIDRIKRIPREPGDLRTKAREIPPPPPLADPDDPAVLEWMRRMGEEL